MSKQRGKNLKVIMFHLRRVLLGRGWKRNIMCLSFVGIVMLIVDITGVYRHLFELDYETQFSYPLDYPNFPDLVTKFRRKEAVPVQPINWMYSNISFLGKAEEGCNSKKFRLIILVKSAPTNFKKRAAIRSTWGYPRRFSDVAIKTVFLLGQVSNPKVLTTQLDGKIRPLEYTITAEMGRYEDIVRADFLDSYYNNTIKVMTGMRWLVEVCPNYRFALICDDDMFVSVKNLLKFVRNPTEYPEYWENQKKVDAELANKFGRIEPTTSPSSLDKNELGRTLRTGTAEAPYNSSGRKTTWRVPIQNIPLLQRKQMKPRQMNNPVDFDIDLSEDAKLFSGFVYKAPPHRHKWGTKWFLSIKDYPFNSYPPYVAGGALVLSKSAVLDMYYASFYTKHLDFDDVYVALLARKMDLEPFHSDYFKYQPSDKSNPFTKENEYVICLHGYDDPEELKRDWHSQKALSRA